MAYQEILYDVSDRIATITMNRPDKLNAWTMRMDKEVRHAMLAAEADSNVRVIIFTGAGKGFCAGADMGLLSSIAGGGSVSAGDDITSGAGDVQLPDAPVDYQQQYSYFPAISKPIIGAVNGAAAGLGFVLMLYCDIRFGAAGAKLTTTFARRGLIAEYGLAWMLPRLIGMTHAMELMLSARTILVEEAMQLGLFSRVYPADAFMKEVRAYAKDMADRVSPRSTRIIKRQVYAALLGGLKPALDVAIEEMIQSLGSDDFREGVAHYLEKRDPRFAGK